MKRLYAIAGLLMCVTAPAWAYLPLLTIETEDLNHMPLLVNCSTNAATAEFTILFQRRGILRDARNPTLELRKPTGETLFRGRLTEAGFIADAGTVEIRFEVGRDQIPTGTFSIQVSGEGWTSAVLEFPLALLFRHFAGHAEAVLVQPDQKDNPVSRYFTQNKFDPRPMYEKIAALWERKKPREQEVL